jgi:hypothetical protein
MKKKKYLKRVLLLFVIILVTPIVVAFVAITFYKNEITGLLIDKDKKI